MARTPGAVIKAMGAAGQTPGQQQAMALIQQYMRIEV